MEDGNFTRRLFCRGLALAPLLPILNIMGIVGCATTRIYRGALVNGRVTVLRDELDRRYSKNKIFIVQIPEIEYPIIVVQRGANKYHALSVRCTHQGCHVRPSGNALACPCHGSTYDLEGQVIHGPAKAPLQRFVVEVTANGIEVVVPQK